MSREVEASTMSTEKRLTIEGELGSLMTLDVEKGWLLVTVRSGDAAGDGLLIQQASFVVPKRKMLVLAAFIKELSKKEGET